MFTGEYIVSLDPKSRITIPSRLRKYIKTEAENKLILTRGLDGCIHMYPANEWEKVQNSLSSLNIFDPTERHFLREFLSFVNICEIDSQNRILLPQRLVEYGKFKKEVVLIGLLDKIEIWDPEIKKSYDSIQEVPFEKIAEIVTRNIKQQNNPT